MKKIVIFLLITFVILLSGCINEEQLKFEDDIIYISQGDSYTLVPIYSLEGITYDITNNQIATVNDEGTILAKQIGETTITARYKTQVFIIAIIVLEHRDLTVYFIDVGQGDAIFIELPNGENLFIDVGHGNNYKAKAWENILGVLEESNVETIHHLIITHNHSDHYAFIPDILKRYEVINLYGSGSVRSNVQYLEIMKSIQDANLEYLVLSVGDLIIDEELLKLQVVATQQLNPDNDPNISSVMARLVYKDVAFMFTGDGGFKSSRDAEYIALHSNLELKSDVLKVGHHGSRNSSGTAFLNAVQPKYAIFTTVENSSDGLPTIEAINRILAVGAQIYQTKDHGTITIVSDGKNIIITTEK